MPNRPLLALVLLLSLVAISRSVEAAPGDSDEQQTGSISDAVNDVITPIVDQAAAIMFWDPFAALGIYDPIIYDDSGKPVLDDEGEVKKSTFPMVVLWLIGTALFFTIKLRFINFRGFKHAVALISGRYSDPDAPGDLTHFQALSTAVSGTVGLGNIAGVAIAISMGGPGATFWIMLAGLLGMATKFAECTLGVKYREISDTGEVSGGPPYYLSRGLARHNWPRLGKALAGVWASFAILGSLGGGNMFQANQSYGLAAQTFPALQGEAVWFGVALAILVGVVIVGGIHEIGKVTGKLVPAMALLYVSSSLFIILSNVTLIDDVVVLIFQEAFSPTAAEGGFLGAMVIGLRRAAFSNEAGVGTAAIAHAAAKTREPVAEGMVALHEPFIDTVVVCTLTAFVLIITGHYQGGSGAEGAALTAAAFGTVSPWFPYVLTFSILLFSFSTQVSFSYYGVKCFDYVFGGLFERALGRREYAAHVFRVVFLLAVVVGTVSSVRVVVALSDLIIFGLILTNTVGLFIMASEVKSDLDDYKRRLASGEIKKVTP